jgi:hypothetical protein
MPKGSKPMEKGKRELVSSIYIQACATSSQYSYLDFINEECMMGGACEKKSELR